MDKGCIQLYYGDGKGKTTAAIGQIVRCVGHGFKVLVYQFLKEPTSGEVSVIRSLPGVEYIPNEGPIPFMFNLTPEQQEFYKQRFQKAFDEVRQKFFTGEYDLVVLDEVIDAYNLGVVPQEQVIEMMEKKPEGTELVITGHDYGMDISALTDRADYVTKFVKEKHPFDLGMGCRKSDKLEIEIESVVYNQYADQIKQSVQQVLDELDVKSGKISVNDKGAVDCVIQARVETAIKRAGGEN